MPTPLCTDPVVLNLWHPLAAIAETAPGRDHTTTLLEEQIAYALTPDGGACAWRQGAPQHPLPALVRYGYLWTSLGAPPEDLFSIPEYDEPDRRNMNASTIGVHVSAPRAIENFLDMDRRLRPDVGHLSGRPRRGMRRA